MHLAKWFGSIVLVCVFALAAVSCNTVEGLGEDVQGAGEGMSEAARNVGDSLDSEE
jgi:predicted small secreted protein